MCAPSKSLINDDPLVLSKFLPRDGNVISGKCITIVKICIKVDSRYFPFIYSNAPEVTPV